MRVHTLSACRISSGQLEEPNPVNDAPHIANNEYGSQQLQDSKQERIGVELFANACGDHSAYTTREWNEVEDGAHQPHILVQLD